MTDFDRFEICLAHATLEEHYNQEGILRQRPSNVRRNESTGCQLARIGFHQGMDYLDPFALGDDQDHENAQTIYWSNALIWGLPICEVGRAVCRELFTQGFLAQHGIQCG